jgi:DNA-binding MarR family transcriptional regulator
VKFPSQFKNDAESSIGLIFIKAYNIWHTQIRTKLREIGVTHPQFVLMTTLAYLSQKDEHISQARVAQTANMDETSVSQIVRALIGDGYMARSDNPNDTRSYALSLTKKGEEIVQTALPIVETIDEEFFDKLGDQKRLFLSLLHKLADAN